MIYYQRISVDVIGPITQNWLPLQCPATRQRTILMKMSKAWVRGDMPLSQLMKPSYSSAGVLFQIRCKPLLIKLSFSTMTIALIRVESDMESMEWWWRRSCLFESLKYLRLKLYIYDSYTCFALTELVVSWKSWKWQVPGTSLLERFCRRIDSNFTCLLAKNLFYK